MTGQSPAAVFLGLPLSAAVTGLIALLLPGDPKSHTLPVLLCFVPLWVAVMSLAFAFRSARATWGWMSLATTLAYGLLFGLKATGLVVIPA